MDDAEAGGEQQSEEREEGEATSAEARHWLTNDGLAYALNLSLIGVVAASVMGHTPELNGTLLTVYATSIALANLWAFGSRAAGKLSEMLTGGK